MTLPLGSATTPSPISELEDAETLRAQCDVPAESNFQTYASLFAELVRLTPLPNEAVPFRVPVTRMLSLASSARSRAWTSPEEVDLVQTRLPSPSSFQTVAAPCDR